MSPSWLDTPGEVTFPKKGSRRVAKCGALLVYLTKVWGFDRILVPTSQTGNVDGRFLSPSG
eukprot:scaffold260844_cov67-Attheya_sp.AAC.1